MSHHGLLKSICHCGTFYNINGEALSKLQNNKTIASPSESESSCSTAYRCVHNVFHTRIGRMVKLYGIEYQSISRAFPRTPRRDDRMMRSPHQLITHEGLAYIRWGTGTGTGTGTATGAIFAPPSLRYEPVALKARQTF